jgi:chromatin remodeling complex protein RSC6
MSSVPSSATNIMNASKTSTKKVTKKDETVVVAAVITAPATKSAKAPIATATAADATATAAPVVAAKKAAKTAATAVVVAPVAAVAATTTTPAVATTTEVVEEVRLETEAKSITARLLAVRETVSELISEAKRLEKKAAKVQKLADKRRRRKAPVEGEEGKPVRVSIFQIPTDISPALCAFMGRASGSQESRSNVTKYITTYVKEKNLKNKHDITADAPLLKLLNLTTEDKLTYFNLQKYLNIHYLKKDKPLAAAATATA